MDSAMGAKYQIGQKVIIRPVSEQPLTSRESDIDTYAGQIGEVSNFYWISPRSSEIFYIYNVRVGSGYKELVLYEDELEVCLA
jgi:hypothetical protein